MPISCVQLSKYKMTDFLTSSPCEFSDNRFLFNTNTKVSTESSPKLSMDMVNPVANLTNSKENIGNTTTNKKPLKNGKNIGSCGQTSNLRNSGQRSSHSSGDSSISSCGGSSVASVFYRAKENANSGNEYVREPIKVISNLGPQRLYPNEVAKCNDNSSCMSLKSKVTAEEVTYTLTDEMDDASNQLVFLPPPPTDLDSDNDSVGGCEVGGPCSPRHLDWQSSRDLSKSPTSRVVGQTNNKCLCCMLLVFVLSTVGLTGVIVLMYMGKLQLAPIPNVLKINQEGRPRPGEGALTREVCDSPSCLKTSASILSRMNTSANPCENFYNYACGGYIKEVDLSWFKTRMRETPDEVIDEHRKFIIDRLSTSFDPTDDKLLASSKEIFRSCLFKSTAVDERMKSVVSETIENLGGLFVSAENTDLTMLLANVTRMFGASPFFKVIVHSDKNISLISKVTEHNDPWTAGRYYSRTQQISKQTDVNANLARLTEILTQLITPSVNETDARNIVSEFTRLEAHIRRILNTGHDQAIDEEFDTELGFMCDVANNRKTMGELQIKYGGFGIDWITFFQNVLESVDVSEVRLCKVKLSLELQHLLKITPKLALRQFIILHTLIHSDLFILFSNGHQHFMETQDGEVTSETVEDRCLDILIHFLPSLEKFAGCDEDTLFQNRGNAFGTLRNIRSALYTVLSSSFKIPKDNAALVTNSSMKPVFESISNELLTGCLSSSRPQGPFDNNFNSNMLRIIHYHHGEYFKGRLSRLSKDIELSALWISTSVHANHRHRAGPIIYPAPVPQPIIYGSLGSFMASRVADGLGIEELLNHHAEGLLNHSTVLNLAVRLNCLAEMYGKMDILDYGAQVYKVDGELTKGQQWKDQLALKLSFQAWRELDNELEADHFIPGLTFTRPQLFFISFAQTHCEKVSERGILEHYVSENAHPGMPSQQRVNGILQSFDEFSEAFQCSDNMYMNPMEKCRIFG